MKFIPLKTFAFFSFLFLTSCSFTQDDTGSTLPNPVISSVNSANEFINDGKLDSTQMARLFEQDTSLRRIVISNSDKLARAFQLNKEYLLKKGNRSASPQRSLYYTYQDLQKVNRLLASQESDTLDLSGLKLQKIWGGDKMGNVQFTSYYLPIVEVSREKDSLYRYPIYKKPPSRYLQSLTRTQIDEQHLLSGKKLEIAYAKNYFDVFSMQVQGSGYVQFEDGSKKLFSYGGKNNRAYFSIGKYLIDQQHISKAEISMQSIRSWLEMNPDSVSILMKNASYVYFQESNKEPSGAAGVPLIDFVSIASDFNYLPKGAILLGEIPVLDESGVFVNHEYRILMVHDTGGAIKGAGHVDLYAGVGEDAGEYAGRMKHFGRLWIILP